MTGETTTSKPKKTRPLRSTAQEAVVGLWRTASMLRFRFSIILEPHGLTPQQYNVLRILRGADGPLQTMEISNRMIEETPGITRLLDRLEKKRLVKRERCADDRRCVLCTITPKGLRLLKQLDEPVDTFDEEAVAMLSRKDQKALVELLDVIQEGIP